MHLRAAPCTETQESGLPSVWLHSESTTREALHLSWRKGTPELHDMVAKPFNWPGAQQLVAPTISATQWKQHCKCIKRKDQEVHAIEATGMANN